MGNWSVKKLLALFSIVFQYVIITSTISNINIYQPQSVTAKILIIERHIKMRDDLLYRCVIDKCTSSAIQSIELVIVELKDKYATMFTVITAALLIESCYSSCYRFHMLIKNEL